MQKNDLRKEMRSVLAAITPEQRHIRSLDVCHQLQDTPEFRRAETIMLFLSMEQEVETSTLVLQAWKEGKTVALPRVRWAEREIEPVAIKSLDTSPNPSMQGLRDPAGGTPISLARIDLVAVPGLAFDRRGYRLGRGKGFYDRFLSKKDFHGLRIALCFQEQLLEDLLPVEPHDMPMNMIVTDQKILRCNHP
ncbi:MAG: 5-formyltetrahydrofolate cyclo-ligase [Phycisphaerae bacterium]